MGAGRKTQKSTNQPLTFVNTEERRIMIQYRDARRRGWNGITLARTMDQALDIKVRLEKQGFIVDMPEPSDAMETETMWRDPVPRSAPATVRSGVRRPVRR
jgi:hypothetical protein